MYIPLYVMNLSFVVMNCHRCKI